MKRFFKKTIGFIDLGNWTIKIQYYNPKTINGVLLIQLIAISANLI